MCRMSFSLDGLAWMQALVTPVSHWMSVPEQGMGAVFVVALVSATLLPMGSEPAVWGLVSLRPELFWPAIGVATAGNTLGGALTWWMGRGAQIAWARARHRRQANSADRDNPDRAPPGPEDSAAQRHARNWLMRWGAPACLMSWLPVVGDPLCAVAGWLHLPFWPCLAFMAVGKFLRYVGMTLFLMNAF
jgi:membrane protein YqaA with SNARE-associated domain